MGNIQFMMA